MPWRRGERTGNRFGGSRCRKTCWPVDHWARAKFERAQETGLVQQLKRLPTTCWSAYDRPSQNAFYQLVMPKFSQFPFSRCPSLAFPRRNTLLADFFKLLLAQLLGCAAVWQKISSNSMSCCLAVNFAESAFAQDDFGMRSLYLLRSQSDQQLLPDCSPVVTCYCCYN